MRRKINGNVVTLPVRNAANDCLLTNSTVRLPLSPASIINYIPNSQFLRFRLRLARSLLFRLASEHIRSGRRDHLENPRKPTSKQKGKHGHQEKASDDL